METRTYQVYKFKELSEDGQQKALETLSDININYEWWDYLYDDANIIGLKIEEWDLYKRNIRGKLLESVGEVCRQILLNHGKRRGTYKLAQDYYKKKFLNVPYIAEDFSYCLLQEYLSDLQGAYDYLTSEEAIKETIDCNNYNFTEDGMID